MDIFGNAQRVLALTPNGLYCPKGDFYIDPWRPVKRAVITHAHADHARAGSQTYLCAHDGKALLQARLGGDTQIETLKYGQPLRMHSVELSLHPAGHILGSSQVRIASGGYVCVFSGDTKTASDPTCAPIEPLRCNTFISESTFGLPIFKWPSTQQIIGEIQSWWQENQSHQRTSILFAYALGKAQRILATIDPTIGPIYTHGAVEKINQSYRDAGISLPVTRYVGDIENRHAFRKALVIAPPSADNPTWMRRFSHPSRAFASGWMRIRGNRRRRSVDRGFVFSDHSDWDGLVQTIVATDADHIGVTHGYAEEMVRWLQEQGRQAEVVRNGHRDDRDAREDPS